MCEANGRIGWCVVLALWMAPGCLEVPSREPGASASDPAWSAGDAGWWLTDAAPGDAVPGDAVPSDATTADASWPADAAPRGCAPVEYQAFPDVLLDLEGRSASKAFEVPADVASVVVVVVGRSSDTYVVEELSDGNGQPWVSATPHGTVVSVRDAEALVFPGPFLSPNRAVWGQGVATAGVPNNPGVHAAAGQWHARVAGIDALGAPARALVNLWVMTRPAPGPECGGPTLALHLHFTGAGGWWAGTAGHDPRFRRLLRTVTALYRDAGIAVRLASMSDLDARLRIVEVPGGLSQVFARGAAEMGVDVFLVGRLQDASGSPLAGATAAIPGPARMPGTAASGVAVAVDLLGDADAVGVAVAHEVGHFLGLFHPDERDGRYPDQLADTPRGDAAAANVMYRSTVTGAQRFSPMQATVMGRSLTLSHTADQ